MEVTIKLVKFNEASKIKLIKKIKEVMTGFNLVQVKQQILTRRQIVTMKRCTLFLSLSLTLAFSNLTPNGLLLFVGKEVSRFSASGSQGKC